MNGCLLTKKGNPSHALNLVNFLNSFEVAEAYRKKFIEVESNQRYEEQLDFWNIQYKEEI
jgi:hypothetical protein